MYCHLQCYSELLNTALLLKKTGGGGGQGHALSNCVQSNMRNQFGRCQPYCCLLNKVLKNGLGVVGGATCCGPDPTQEENMRIILNICSFTSFDSPFRWHPDLISCDLLKTLHFELLLLFLQLPPTPKQLPPKLFLKEGF